MYTNYTVLVRYITTSIYVKLTRVLHEYYNLLRNWHEYFASTLRVHYEYTRTYLYTSKYKIFVICPVFYHVFKFIIVSPVRRRESDTAQCDLWRTRGSLISHQWQEHSRVPIREVRRTNQLNKRRQRIEMRRRSTSRDVCAAMSIAATAAARSKATLAATPPGYIATRSRCYGAPCARAS